MIPYGVVGAKNLTDEHIVNNVDGLAYETVGRPRTIGVSTAADF